MQGIERLKPALPLASAEAGTDEVIDCSRCGCHYEATPDDDLHDVKDRIAVEGFCCDYCKDDAGSTTGSDSGSYSDSFDRETEELNAYDYRNEQEAERRQL